MSTGWIKLHRSLIDWEWYDDHNATRLLIHVIISVNYEDKKWKGVEVKKGSMIFSWGTLSEAVGLTQKQCRTAMSKLEKSGEVARFVAGRWQVLTLIKWGKLQSNEGDMAGNRAGSRQDEGRMRATTKEYNKIINKEVEEESASSSFFNIEVLKEEYLSNDRMINAVCGNQKNYLSQDIIEKRLIEFNLFLTEQGVFVKSPNDYNSHFRNWHLLNRKNNTQKKKQYL